MEIPKAPSQWEKQIKIIEKRYEIRVSWISTFEGVGAKKYYYENSESSSEFWASTSLELIHVGTVYGVTALAAYAGVVCGPGAPVCSTVFAIGGAIVAEQYIVPVVVNISSKGLDYVWKKSGW